jgi:CelD/BcsL family acetyltransferase involved in cellulose biosynthesis
VAADTSNSISTSAPVLSARILRGVRQIQALEPEWAQLFARANDAWAFLSPAWTRAWLMHGRVKGEVAALTVWAGNQLVALLVVDIFRRGPGRVAVPLGTGCPAYLGVLRDPQYSEAVATLADLCDHERPFDALVLHDFSSLDTSTSAFLSEMLRKGFSTRSVHRRICWYVELGKTYEDFLITRRSASTRKKLRYNERKLIDSHGKLEYYVGVEIQDSHLDRIAEIQEYSWMKRRGAAVLGQPFFKTLLRQMADAGAGRLWILTINGEDAAFVFGISAHDRMVYLWTSFKLEYVPLRAGNVLINWTIRDACAEGLQVCDFSHGDAEYKSFWSTNQHDVSRYVLARGVVGESTAFGYYLVWRVARARWSGDVYRRLRTIIRYMMGGLAAR